MKGYYYEISSDEIKNKNRALNHFMRSMLDKTNNIFQYEGLPDTIPVRFLELYLQNNGNCIVTESDGKLYAFTGGLGGEPDEYYQPTVYTVSNPYLNFNKNLKIGEEGILCRNDSMLMGLKPIFLKYGNLIIENLISFRIAAINTRISTIIDASDDSAAESAKEYLKKIENGELGIIASDDIFSKINVNPAAVHDRCIIDLIELHQYLLSQMYSEIGITDNYNMKKERLTDEEASMMGNKSSISLENMYIERCEFCDKINKKYGLNIRVSINERWCRNEQNLTESISEWDKGRLHGHSSDSNSMDNWDDSEQLG